VAVFFSTFLGVSRQGEFENTITIFWQKIRVENFFQNFDKTIRCQFFLDFFCFIAFSGVFQRWEFKNTRKNALQKKSCRKVFTKNLTKSPKPIFFSKNFCHVFGRFSVRGVQKYDKKNSGAGGAESPFCLLACGFVVYLCSAITCSALLLYCTDCTLAQPLPLPTANSAACLTQRLTQPLQCHDFGHRNTLAAHKLPACNSWRCSLIYAHPRGPRLPPAFGPKKAPALTPACESA
jgi:hypothetical protein